MNQNFISSIKAISAVYNRFISLFFTIIAFAYTISVFHLGRGRKFRYHGLNPEKLCRRSARLNPILLLHGYKGNQACWLRLAKSLKEAGLGPVYTVNIGADYAAHMGEDGWQEVLEAKIEEIRNQYHLIVDDMITIDIIGHSLGAIRAVNYVYSKEKKVRGIRFGKIISIAGRLKVTKRKVTSLITNLLPMIEKGYKNMRERFHLADLYTIAAQNDFIVPIEAVFVNRDPDKRLYVKNCGHLSVLYAKEVHETIIDWLKID